MNNSNGFFKGMVIFDITNILLLNCFIYTSVLVKNLVRNIHWTLLIFSITEREKKLNLQIIKWVKTEWSLSSYRNQREMCMRLFGRMQLRWWTVTNKHFMRSAMGALHPLWPPRWTVLTITVRWYPSVICTSHPGVVVGLSKTSLANTSSTSRMFYFIFIKLVWIERNYYWTLKTDLVWYYAWTFFFIITLKPHLPTDMLTVPVIFLCYPWHDFITLEVFVRLWK